MSNQVLINKIDPKKSLNSKWTAVTPTKKEKHFLVSEIGIDEEGIVISYCIDAAM